MGKFYAVKNGRIKGIFNTWDECKAQVDGFSGATYKSFKTLEEAKIYMGDADATTCVKSEPALKTAVATEKDVMVVYVDGSYNNLTKEFSYGFIAFCNGETIRDAKAFNDEELATMRNVAGEIKGSEAAIRLAIEMHCKEVHVYHDYEGIAKWPLGEWKANKEGTITYKRFYDENKDKLAIVFHKVTGHSGDVYNDEADRLAKSALGL